MHRDESGPSDEKSLKSRPHSPGGSVRLFALFFGLGFGLLALLSLVFIFPLEWSEAKSRFRFWRAGARPILWEKHRGFQLDRCAGKAPAECPCVWFVHGLGDTVATWRRFFIDKEIFGARPVRLFAIDLPGHGGSLKRRNVEEYRVSAMAAELDREIGAETFRAGELQIGRTDEQRCVKNVLVGNSFGGWVATLMALRTPAHYQSLVLVSPSGTSASDEATRDLFREPSVASLKEFQSRAYFRPRELTDSQWATALARMSGSGVEEVRTAQLSADRLDGKIKELRVPTTIIWGEADRILPRAVMDSFTREISGTNFRTIPECGHLPQKECPDRLGALLRAAIP